VFAYANPTPLLATADVQRLGFHGYIMTNESLEEYIKMYNSGCWNVPISSYRISENVVLGKVWHEYPSGTKL